MSGKKNTEPSINSEAQQNIERPSPKSPPAKEIGGRQQGLDPTRYGDWEKNGRCIDF